MVDIEISSLHADAATIEKVRNQLLRTCATFFREQALSDEEFQDGIRALDDLIAGRLVPKLDAKSIVKATETD